MIINFKKYKNQDCIDMNTLKGYVFSINVDDKFTIIVDDKKIKCHYQDFLPIQKFDIIEVKGNTIDDIFYLSKKPLVVIPYDYKIIRNGLIKGLRGEKFGAKKSDEYIEYLKEYNTGIKEIFNNFDKYAVNMENSDLNYLNKRLSLIFLLWWKKNICYRRLYLLGLTNTEIMNSELDLNSLYNILQKNPYVIFSIDKDKADMINTLLELNISEESKNIGDMSKYVKKILLRNGWMGVPLEMFKKRFPNYKQYEEKLTSEYMLFFDEDLVYTLKTYKAETCLFKNFNILIESTKKIKKIESPIRDSFKKEKDGIILTDEQEEALIGVLESNISIITGGAGCGKTTLIKRLIEVYTQRREEFVLTSFTGKAVSRIKESLGDDYENLNYFTLHRMIHTKKMGKWKTDFYNLIVDEASMISCELFYDFMATFTHKFNIVFIGDINQLPPIGCGSLLLQLINSKKIDTYYLTENKRSISSKGVSGIIKNSNDLVNHNGSQPFKFKDFNGFKSLEGDINLVFTLVKSLKKANVDDKELCVITPLNKNIDIINKMHQKLYLCDSKTIFFNEKNWYIGDRVMQIKNVYMGPVEVMNGEEGIITDILDDKIVVKYSEDKSIEYLLKIVTDREKMDIGIERNFYITDITHSFCKTVHKSQGSEYTFVIFYIPYCSSNFFNKNLLYTGITRARKGLWLVYDKQTLDMAISNTIPKRFEKLSIRL